jgi:hypothetical protein
MSQVTIYLDPDTEQKMRVEAKAAGVSVSKWVGDIIRLRTAAKWPKELLDLAGSWPDFPEAEDIRAGMGQDAPREKW